MEPCRGSCVEKLENWPRFVEVRSYITAKEKADIKAWLKARRILKIHNGPITACSVFHVDDLRTEDDGFWWISVDLYGLSDSDFIWFRMRYG